MSLEEGLESVQETEGATPWQEGSQNRAGSLCSEAQGDRVPEGGGWGHQEESAEG